MKVMVGMEPSVVDIAFFGSIGCSHYHQGRQGICGVVDPGTSCSRPQTSWEIQGNQWRRWDYNCGL